MEELIAKRYAKALFEICSEKELREVIEGLQALANLFDDWKIKEFLISPEVKAAQKEEVLLAPFKKANKKFINLIKLLAQRDRLGIIPALAKELQLQMALKEGRFEGRVYSEFELSQNELDELAKALERRVGGKVTLKQVDQNYDGIKVEVDTVGIEIDFSKSKIQKQLIENILKAI